jgi:hypothetical protein
VARTGVAAGSREVGQPAFGERATALRASSRVMFAAATASAGRIQGDTPSTRLG